MVMSWLTLLSRAHLTSGRLLRWLVVVYDDTGKPSEAELEKAKAKYRKEHPDWQERDFNVIWVIDEDCKRMTEEILQGKGTEQ